MSHAKSMASSPLEANGGVPLDNAGMSGAGMVERSNAKLLNRFYEPLHLLRILNADRGPGEVDLPPDPQSRDFRMIWRRFLDDLSWLCDNKHGGETVSAVAAQELPEDIKFWLVSKRKASFGHLQWVLENLKTIREQSEEKKAAEALRIASESIVFSKDKVKNYARFLKLALAKIKEIRAACDSVGGVALEQHGV